MTFFLPPLTATDRDYDLSSMDIVTDHIETLSKPGTAGRSTKVKSRSLSTPEFTRARRLPLWSQSSRSRSPDTDKIAHN
jgi:hypothetical protein